MTGSDAVDSRTAVVATEADPTPLVLSLARTVRASAHVPELRELMAATTGTVALRSANDAQAATLTFGGAGVHVSHGVAPGAEQVELHLFPEYTLADATEPAGMAAATLLSPPLPDWRDAAAKFWEVNQGSPGFPGRLVVVCTDDDAEATFGEGGDVFEVHGDGFSLASVLSGQLDSFVFAVGLGMVTVLGSLAHLSAICAAHWKVRFGG